MRQKDYICPECSWEGTDPVCPVCETITEPLEVDLDNKNIHMEQLPSDIDSFDDWEESEDDDL